MFEFDHEKMSQADLDRYGEVMQGELDKLDKAESEASVEFPPNSGAPLDPEAVKAGLTWDSETRKYVTHQSLGAKVYKLQPGWQRFFEGTGKRYAYPLRLKVVSIVYDWKVFN